MISVNFTAMPAPGHRLFFHLTIYINQTRYDLDCHSSNSTLIPQVVVKGICKEPTVIVTFPATVKVVLEVRVKQGTLLCDTVVIGPQSKYICVFVECTISANVCIL